MFHTGSPKKNWPLNWNIKDEFKAVNGGRRNVIAVTSDRATWSVHEWVWGLGEEVGTRSPMCFNGTKRQLMIWWELLQKDHCKTDHYNAAMGNGGDKTKGRRTLSSWTQNLKCRKGIYNRDSNLKIVSIQTIKPMDELAWEEREKSLIRNPE